VRKESHAFLESLINAPSMSGFEQPLQRVVREWIAPYADTVTTDVNGNVIAALNPTGSPRVMLAGHCDQIGLMVQHITDEGFLQFSAVGGIDAGVVSGVRVIVHTKDGPVPGIIGRKPIHLQNPEERRGEKFELHKLWIDIGAKDKAAAQKLVRIADPISFELGLLALQGELIAGPGMDDKVGVFAVMEALRLLSKRHPKAAVFAVSTVQEELGLRGARTAAYAVDPQVGIAVDVTFATDYPGIDKGQVGDIRLGKGPVIARGPNINPKVHDLLVGAADKKKIAWQPEAIARATGTDANAMQISREGVAAGLVSVPNRYMHTAIEMISLDDLENTSIVLAEAVASMGPKTSFIPM
jgi:endoglucanase